jgi:GST-like protein
VLHFHYNTGPNPQKVALFLEEAGVAYEGVPVETRKGAQHTAAYRAINPNGKAPTLVDGDVAVFDSNAILLHLGEKTGRFMPADTPTARGELLSWLMFVATGIGPYSGQAVHFKEHAREDLAYAVGRYQFEAERHYAIIDQRLAGREWMVGDTYTIVDMALWGWARISPRVLGQDAFDRLEHLPAWLDRMNARPAVARVGELMQRFRFQIEIDEEARRHMFPGEYHHAG